jgi:hypothetical protein
MSQEKSTVIDSVSFDKLNELQQQLILREHAVNALEANALIDEMVGRIMEGEDPDEILLDYGLEADYSVYLFD